MYPEPDGKIAYRDDRMYKYAAQQQFMLDMASNFMLGDENTRLGLVGFANLNEYTTEGNAKLLNGYRNHLNLSTDYELINTAFRTTTSAGGTHVEGGLMAAKKMLDAHARPDAQQVVVLLLDGVPDDISKGTMLDAAAAPHEQATVIAIGYSGADDFDAMASIASEPASEWVYTEFEIDTLAQKLSSSFASICDQIQSEGAPSFRRVGQVAVEQDVCSHFADEQSCPMSRRCTWADVIVKAKSTAAMKEPAFVNQPGGNGNIPSYYEVSQDSKAATRADNMDDHWHVVEIGDWMPASGSFDITIKVENVTGAFVAVGITYDGAPMPVGLMGYSGNNWGTEYGERIESGDIITAYVNLQVECAPKETTAAAL